MQARKIAFMGNESCDWYQALSANSHIEMIKLSPDTMTQSDLDDCDSIIIAGGYAEYPVKLPADAQMLIEKQLLQGKRVLAEYVAGIAGIYYLEPRSTRFSRMIVTTDLIQGVSKGGILDDNCNMHTVPFQEKTLQRPFLVSVENIGSYDTVENVDEYTEMTGSIVGAFYGDNLMLCCFRACNYVRGRFIPGESWQHVIKWMLSWACGTPVQVDMLPPAYRIGGAPDRSDLRETVRNAMGWFENNGIVVNEGKGGVLEGLKSEVYPNGDQPVAPLVRTDNTGETMLLYYLYYRLTGDTGYLEKSRNMGAFLFGKMQVQDGALKGMLRWSDQAWGVCYQDDAARAILPGLFISWYSNDPQYLDRCGEALDFLARSTGTDGTRIPRTDHPPMSKDDLMALSHRPGKTPSAHYNAYYAAALLLGGFLLKRDDFCALGGKCLETIMASYPHTMREVSETEEMARLILPLAMKFFVTKAPGDLALLDKVAGDLEKVVHPCGGYQEWDTGYLANNARKFNAESALLHNNGDPVADLLYSNNWLPMAFIQAHFITGDKRYKDRFNRVSTFLANAQLRSDNPLLHGAWARGLDMAKMEVAGSNNDVGWGPWSVESGWSVAEIASGMCLGLLEDELTQLYDESRRG